MKRRKVQCIVSYTTQTRKQTSRYQENFPIPASQTVATDSRKYTFYGYRNVYNCMRNLSLNSRR